ncbi:MAG: glycosyltransferase family 2 protein [Chitinophagaceae bacterium]
MTQIIILNWNGGSATWRCIEAVCALPNTQLTLVDNASTDESLTLIETSFTERNIPFLSLEESEVDRLRESEANIVIVRAKANLGFAKGINLVLRPLLFRKDLDFVWLLNNDAIAAPDALEKLEAALQAMPKAGFAGSMIMDAQNRAEIQCFGVQYFPWLSVAKMLHKGEMISVVNFNEIDNDQVDFQHGASLLVRVQMIRLVGLLDERFFLYSEEHDWQTRAAKASYSNIRVGESKVFHEGSMSTARDKHLFYFYYCRSSVFYSRKHHHGFQSIIATLMLASITAIRTRLHPKSMVWAMKGIAQAWRIIL